MTNPIARARAQIYAWPLPAPAGDRNFRPDTKKLRLSAPDLRPHGRKFWADELEIWFASCGNSERDGGNTRCCGQNPRLLGLKFEAAGLKLGAAGLKLGAPEPESWGVWLEIRGVWLEIWGVWAEIWGAVAAIWPGLVGFRADELQFWEGKLEF